MRLALLLLAGLPASAQVGHDRYDRAFDAAVRHGHLAARPRCLAYEDFEETADHVDAGVREKHGPGCPGDPATEPRLFTLRYVKATGRVLQSDDLAGPDIFRAVR